MEARVRSFVVAALVAWSLLSPRQARAAITFSYRTSEVANLTYQLHCLARTTTCSEGAFAELWLKHLGFTDDDKRYIEALRALVDRNRIDRELGEDAPLPFPLLDAPAWDLVDRLQLIGYQADSFDDYAARAHALLNLADANELVAIVAHFRPRFATWWRGQEPWLLRYTAGLRALVVRHELERFAEDVRHFYATRFPADGSLHFLVIARPRTDEEKRTHQVHSNASVHENQAPLEIVDDEKPEDKIDVALHELFHVFWRERTLAQHRALNRLASDAAEPESLGLYALTDEALAAAFGNGLVSERILAPSAYAKLVRENGLYDDPYINTVAVALSERLKRALAAHETLDDRFFVSYLALAKQALGARTDELGLLLKIRGIVLYDPTLRPMMRQWRNRLRACATSTNIGDGTTELDKRPLLSGVVFVGRGDLARATRLPVDVRKAAEAARWLVWSDRRSPKSDVYYLVGQDADALAEAGAALVRHGKRFAGLAPFSPSLAAR